MHTVYKCRLKGISLVYVVLGTLTQIVDTFDHHKGSLHVVSIYTLSLSVAICKYIVNSVCVS